MTWTPFRIAMISRFSLPPCRWIMLTLVAGTLAGIGIAPRPAPAANLLWLPRTDCLTLAAAFDLSPGWRLGPLAEVCETRPHADVGESSGSLGLVSESSLGGPFADSGWLAVAALAAQQRQFESDTGSTAEATFTVFGAFLAYRWQWAAGLNLALGGGGEYEVESGRQRNIQSGESSGGEDALRERTADATRAAALIMIGWVF